MLASAVTDLPRGDGWTYEFKWDGVRALCTTSATGVRLSQPARERDHERLSGAGRGWPAARATPAGRRDRRLRRRPAVVPGAAGAHARPQGRRRAAARREDAGDLHGLRPARRERRRPHRPAAARAARATWSSSPPSTRWTVSPSFDDAAATEQVARAPAWKAWWPSGWPRRYRPGVRTDDWVKLRFLSAGDFVVVGWEESREHPGALSSLVLASHDAGRAGVRRQGRQRADRRVPRATLQRRAASRAGRCPLATVPPVSPGGRSVHWVEPDVVVEVKYTAMHHRRPVAPTGLPAGTKRQERRGGDGLMAGRRRR